MHIRKWAALGLIILAITGCNGYVMVGGKFDDTARAEAIACPKLWEHETMVAPPGEYANPKITIDYDRLVPRPDPRKNIDMGYASYVKSNPEMVEQLYYHATHGNERAAWLICHVEVSARNLGRDMARFLNRASCQALLPCRDALRDAMPPLSDETASGRRLLTFIGREFEKEAERIQIKQDLISNALNLIAGVKVASVIRPGGVTLFKVIPGTVQSFGSMSSFRRAMGSAGPGMEWHHIVEQTRSNIARFGPESLHNTKNVIRLDEKIHREISRHYSTKPPGKSQTVRESLSAQSFEAQRAYGLSVLRTHGVIVP